jgi:voltage-gated potassium channel
MVEITEMALGQSESTGGRFGAVDRRFPGKFTLLLVMMLTLMLLPGLLDNRRPEFLMPILLSGVVLATVNVVFEHNRPYHFALACILALVALGGLILAGWIIDLAARREVIITDLACWAVLMAFAVVTIVRRVVTAERVTYDTISAAACGYLLFALMSAYVFILIELFYPGSFIEQGKQIVFRFDPHVQRGFQQTMYFSFVTITGLGYGDITPLGPARMIAAIEAMVGQFYIAVLIARLVSLHSSNCDRASLGHCHLRQEPDAEKPLVRICRGVMGNYDPYSDDTRFQNLRTVRKITLWEHKGVVG